MYYIPTTRQQVKTTALQPVKKTRLPSIDLLRGIVMIIMTLDHVRDYFHRQAFLFSPTDLSQTTAGIFFTRWITHFCAPVFVFLAGVSAFLYGAKKGREALRLFLITRGLWLVIAELLIVTLGWSFNLHYPFFNLQVIWATGISMVVLAVLIHCNKWLVLATAVLLVAGHNFLDNTHITGNGMASFLWALLHEPGFFRVASFTIVIRYPLLPWIGIIALGYFFGHLYMPLYNAKKRHNILLLAGAACIFLFIILRAGNFYGDAAHWLAQKNALLSMLSFLNVTKYPPSLLYILMTLGPAFIFLSLSEKPLYAWAEKISVLGRVPMFYYLLHIFLIHLLAIITAVLMGFHISDMVLSVNVNSSPSLKGYGVNLPIVYLVWCMVILLLYPLCKRFDRYKRAQQASKWWLRYL